MKKLGTAKQRMPGHEANLIQPQDFDLDKIDFDSSWSVKDDLLTQGGSVITRREQCSHFSKDKRNICDFVVLHYTGSHGTYESSNNWAIDPRSKVSWHVTIGRSGEVIQLLDFRTVAWHCGKSEWYSEVTDKHYRSLNRWGIGIEFANTGLLSRTSGGFCRHGTTDVLYDLNERDKLFRGPEGHWWEMFTESQLRIGADIVKMLLDEYECIEVLGHSEIAPKRKIDPGPAFPLQEFKKLAQR